MIESERKSAPDSQLWKRLLRLNSEFAEYAQKIDQLRACTSSHGRSKTSASGLRSLFRFYSLLAHYFATVGAHKSIELVIEELATLEMKLNELRTTTAPPKRTKPKRIVELRATKGRKIRYVPIPKLANFFPAQPESTPWSHERRNELFKSVFKY